MPPKVSAITKKNTMSQEAAGLRTMATGVSYGICFNETMETLMAVKWINTNVALLALILQITFTIGNLYWGVTHRNVFPWINP